MSSDKVYSLQIVLNMNLQISCETKAVFCWSKAPSDTREVQMKHLQKLCTDTLNRVTVVAASVEAAEVVVVVVVVGVGVVGLDISLATATQRGTSTEQCHEMCVRSLALIGYAL
jgi:uncharacterized membrane protein